MKKSKTSAAVAFDKVTPALIEQVDGVLANAAKNKYQASAVYAAHNQVFGLKETPEVCASCNIKRVAALRKWMAEYKMFQIDGDNMAANEEGQALTDVPRETLGDLDSILEEYGAPAFDDVAERDEWLNGLLTQNSLALLGYRQLDAEELEIVNAALVSEEMPNADTTRVTPYDTVDKVLEAWGEGIEGTEAERIKQILDIDAQGADRSEFWVDLYDSEKELLNARLTELTAGTAFKEAINGTMENAQKVAEASQPGANALNTPNTIAGGMDQETEGPEVLNLKNRKGELFTGTFNSEDGVNGALVDAEGNTLKPGTYSTEMGDSYAVQPGGKATYKNDAI